ncbi:MAG: sigma-70 family RNA polymerase sigma factor [Deltaproteobacteria bacterium]|nr:sigma-70 family RNA polymerase sigma factor [Nannocystaceae bacterium]
MNEPSWLAERFEDNRKRLRALAYRMLGSLSEADDAVQEAWLRLGRADADSVQNLAGWLTTVVARVSLDTLRVRRSNREDAVGARMPDPIVDGLDPEDEAVMTDSVSLALLVVLETLDPASRLAFVLHDMFAVPFDEIGRIVGKTPAAARQLASRARRRVQGAATPPDADLASAREVVAAFLAASRDGHFDALLQVLDPDVVLRSERDATSRLVRGASAVAKRTVVGLRLAGFVRLVLVNGTPGLVSYDAEGEPHSVVGFTIRRGRITEIDILADPTRLRQLDLAARDD